MRQNLYIPLTIVLVPVFYALLLKFGFTVVYCQQLSGYDYDDFAVVGSFFKLVFLFLLACWIAILIFYLLNRFVPQFKSLGLQMLYIVLFWTVVFYSAFKVAIQSEAENEIIQSLCAKTTGSGMKVKSENVSWSEYNYLRDDLILLPPLPPDADSISIDYCHDGFLPDFSLHVLVRLPASDTALAHKKHWLEKSRNNRFVCMEYTRSEQ